MLVLTRKVGESIFIGDTEVKVLYQRGRGIRLGVNAPPGVEVHRAEVRERILIDGVRKKSDAGACPQPT